MNQTHVLAQSAEQFMKDGLAFAPVRTEGIGEQTKVMTRTEVSCIDCSTERFLGIVADAFGCDIQSIRRRYGKIIGKRQLVPLPLSLHFILIPFHALNTTNFRHRQGWVRLTTIKNIRVHPEEPTTAMIELSNGREVTSLSSMSFLQEQRKNAELIKYKYKEVHGLENMKVLREMKDMYSWSE